MSDCIFCRLVAGDIPSHKIYEDDHFLAFLDIKPFTPGHALIIPKSHYQWTYDVPEFGKYFEVAKSVAQKQLEVLSPDYVSFLTLGLLVPHAHIHVIPRNSQDGHGEAVDVNHRLSPTDHDLSELSIKLNINAK